MMDINAHLTDTSDGWKLQIETWKGVLEHFSGQGHKTMYLAMNMAITSRKANYSFTTQLNGFYALWNEEMCDRAWNARAGDVIKWK